MVCFHIIFYVELNDQEVTSWRTKQALSGELDGKLRIAMHARMCYIYVCIYIYAVSS